MSQISQPETADLLNKLLTERIPVQAFFFSSFGTRISLPGFVDSVTRDNGVVISVSGAPIDISRGYLNFFPFGRSFDFWYGERRELPPDLQDVGEGRGDSVLLFISPKLAERIGLFFTL